jgi:hypothetical protein
MQNLTPYMKKQRSRKFFEVPEAEFQPPVITNMQLSQGTTNQDVELIRTPLDNFQPDANTNSWPVADPLDSIRSSSPKLITRMKIVSETLF